MTVDIKDAVLVPAPPAVYAMSCPSGLSMDAIHNIQRQWRIEMGPDAKLLILSDGLTLNVVPPPAAVDILMRLIEASDGGSDTYEVQELVEEARTLLGLPSRKEARRLG